MTGGEDLTGEARRRLRLSHPFKHVIETGERVYELEHAFLEKNIPSGGRMWQFVTGLLIARAFQLQRAVLDGVTIGYDEEMHPVSRAMASTVVTLVAIGHGNRLIDRDRKALQYLTFERRARRRQLKYLAQSRWITSAQRSAYDAQSAAEVDEAIQRAAQAGVTPLREGRDSRFWSGYDDRTMFTKMGVARWYHHFYAPWSEESHAQPRALTHMSELVDRVGVYEIGPQKRSPWFLLLATSEFGFQTMVQANKLYRLRRKADLRGSWLDIQRWFSEAAKVIPPHLPM